jgi:6-phosphogluconolactonase (cycloisomerase 2 family)
MSRKILVASYTSNITTLSFDTAASPPSLSVVSSLEVGDRPCWITPHSSDTSVVFTSNEQPDGTVKALKFDLNTGQGKVIAEASSGGADPCHLVVFGDDLITANVSPCQVSLNTIS